MTESSQRGSAPHRPGTLRSFSRLPKRILWEHLECSELKIWLVNVFISLHRAPTSDVRSSEISWAKSLTINHLASVLKTHVASFCEHSEWNRKSQRAIGGWFSGLFAKSPTVPVFVPAAMFLFARSTYLLLNIRNVTYASGIEKLGFFCLLSVQLICYMYDDQIIQFHELKWFIDKSLCDALCLITKHSKVSTVGLTCWHNNGVNGSRWQWTLSDLIST